MAEKLKLRIREEAEKKMQDFESHFEEI